MLDYIIFEHFQNSEERAFSDYGIMTWGEENYQYNEATMGYPSDFSGVSYKSRGFSNPTLVGFMESHDKERLMYKNITYGNSTTEYDIKNFNNSLGRMKAAAALFLTVPGPKMIWQFGELGYEKSINTCEDGTVRSDCKLSPKTSAFELDMDQDTEREKLYGVWSRIIKLRKIEKIFNTDRFNINFSSDMKYLTLEDKDPGDGISKIIIVANFGLDQKEISKAIIPNGSWYNIYANNRLTLVSNDTNISLNPGQFIILADKKSEIEDDEKLLLSSEKKFIDNKVKVYPNPFINKLFIDVDKDTVSPSVIYLFNSSGKLVSYNLWDSSKYFIDYSTLSNGIYNMVLTSRDYVIRKKISKK